MCMCGMTLTRRQWLTMALTASAGTMFLGKRAWAAELSSAAKELLQNTITVDTHSHARGLVFGPKMDDNLATGMREGMLSAVCLAHVPDGPVIGLKAGVLGMVRTPAPGDLYKAHLGRLDWMDGFASGYGMRRVTTLAELRDAKAKGEPALIQDIEGCDFLDGKLERLEEAYRRGVRVVQLVHYIKNDIGDFQTGPVTHNGMTEFGGSVIKELNRLGAQVDVAHATEPLVRGAVKVATKPLLLSHTALQGSKAQGDIPVLAGRQISPDHARMVADTGGVVGLWHFFPSIERYVQGIKEMVDVVGVDHTGVGTDQQVVPGAIQDYAKYGSLADAMLKGGFNADETAKILGGNFVRIFGQATGAA